MSSSKDNRKFESQEQAALAKKTRKQEELDKQIAASKKFSRKVAIITAVVLVLAILILVLTSAWFYRAAPAVKIGDTTYSIGDYNFYSGITYSTYYNYYAQTYGETYAQYLMPDEEGMKELTLNNMKSTAMLVNEAKAAGYTLNDEEMATIQTAFDSVSLSAIYYGFSSENDFLAANYGKGVNMKLYEENFTEYSLATSYAAYLRENYDFSEAEIDSYYAENKDDFDRYTYRLFYFDGSKDMETAEKNAAEFADRLVDGETFADLAYEYASDTSKEAYEDPDVTIGRASGSNLNPDYKTWMVNANRKAGDTTYIKTDEACYVIEYISRDDNDYATVNIRHILKSVETVSKSDYDTDAEYEKALQKASADAYTELSKVEKDWKASEMTEEIFGNYADSESDDGGAVGGLYENVYRHQMTDAFNDWIFDPARVPGETGMVESDYGWHLIYFIGEGEDYCDYLSRSALTTKEYAEWETEQLAAYEVSTKLFFGLAK